MAKTIDSALVLGQHVSNDGFAHAVPDYCRRTVKQARDARDGCPELFVGTHLENLAGHVSGLTIFDQQLRALQVLSIARGTAANAYEPALGSAQAQFIALLATERNPAPTGYPSAICWCERKDKS